MRAVAPADLDAVHALQRRIEAADAIPYVTPREQFADWLTDPFLDLARDTRLVEAGGTVVGWARIWNRNEREREARAYLFGGVDPAHRRQGIGGMLLEWQIARAAEQIAAAPPGLPRFVRAPAYSHEADRLALFARHGLVPARYNDELLRDLADVPPRPATPGITIVPWDDALSEAARVAQNEAFEDHWGSTARDPAAWAHELASHGTRLDLSFLALDGAQVVGVCRNGQFPGDEALTGRRDGWIMNLSTVRSHRKKGIASALIVASLEAFRAAGFTHAALGVDSENPTGAYGLYEQLGFRPTHRVVICQRPLPA